MEKVIVNESPLGRGVFARVPIEQGETIFFVAGKLIDFEASRTPGGEYSIQIGEKIYVDPISPSRFLNHSCQPNAGLVDDIRLIALRQIVPNEEICFDYSTSMLERHWELDCLCGSENCRRVIRDFDLLPTPIQRHYISLGIVQSFILKEIGAPIPPGSIPLEPLVSKKATSDRILHSM